jgi:hypothetical protein
VVAAVVAATVEEE